MAEELGLHLQRAPESDFVFTGSKGAPPADSPQQLGLFLESRYLNIEQ